jgi:hypothetical protein
MPSKHEALSSNLSITKKAKQNTIKEKNNKNFKITSFEKVKLLKVRLKKNFKRK